MIAPRLFVVSVLLLCAACEAPPAPASSRPRARLAWELPSGAPSSRAYWLGDASAEQARAAAGGCSSSDECGAGLFCCGPIGERGTCGALSACSRSNVALCGGGGRCPSGYSCAPNGACEAP